MATPKNPIPSGTQIGHRVVLRQDEKSHCEVRYICRCVCGKEKSVSACQLRKGKAGNCGCHTYAKALIGLAGKTFGRWTVLSYAGGKRWLCRCVCGTEKSIDGAELRKGETKSCGCGPRAVRLTHVLRNTPIGAKFGDWTVVGHKQITTRGGNLSHRPVCRCVCGVEKVVSSVKPQGRSCRCRIRKRPYEHLYTQLVASAARRGHSCDLTFDEFAEFVRIEGCYYCRARVYWSKHAVQGKAQGKGKGNAYNLDRVDNKAGYTKENLVVCCGKCNWRKASSFSSSEFSEVGKLIKRWEGRETVFDRLPVVFPIWAGEVDATRHRPTSVDSVLPTL